MKVSITPAKGLKGELPIPGDKSISHRGVILGAISQGDTRLSNFLTGKDCMSTIQAFRKMGITIDMTDDNSIIVHGKGLYGLNKPDSQLDMGNSGTTTRLLLGLLSGQDFTSVLTGDASLKKRPMGRVTVPLRQMGAIIQGPKDAGYLPLSVKGGNLKGIDYLMPVASAQVKSSIILAGLYADTPSRITEPSQSRNHIEVMLDAFGGRLDTMGNSIVVHPAQQLHGIDIHVPGDISSAAFFITAALLVPGSCITLKGVGINPTRTGILDIYRSMGAEILIENVYCSAGETAADITVKTSDLKAASIGGPIIPRLIDEIPIIALAATQAHGITVISNAGELKVKESNRIESVVNTLTKFGAKVEATDDGMIIHGPTPLYGCEVDAGMDHRIVMAAAIAGLIAQGGTIINGAEWAEISYPGFFETIKGLMSTT